MGAHQAAQSLRDGAWLAAWAKRPAWTILDTQFGNGQRFLATCDRWRADPERCRVLHYVGIVAPDQVFDGAGADSAIALALKRSGAAVDIGFQRLTFEEGHISLTLCRGNVSGVLGELECTADAITLGPHAPIGDLQAPFAWLDAWDKWAIQHLARRSRRGTLLQVCVPTAATSQSQPSALLAGCEAVGFAWEARGQDGGPVRGSFNPRWEISNSRKSARPPPLVPTHAAVIGAGLAGASVARALAIRGWAVSVFDQHDAPARGASGLPVGLVAPQVSADDNVRSRLSRAGVQLMLQHARAFLTLGQEWAPSGVLEHREGASALWHAEAAWIKPAPLVHAWLDHRAIRFVGNAQVTELRNVEGGWELCNRQGLVLGHADLVVFANAMGSKPLLLSLNPGIPLTGDFQQKLHAFQAMHGTLSWGQMTDEMPASMPVYPVNGHGSFVPHVPSPEGPCWYAGSTFETAAEALEDVHGQNAANLTRLCELLPEVGGALKPSFETSGVRHWSNTRCVTHDRLPLVGPLGEKVPPPLWLCAGMGARGLSLAALCAELLVARLGGEPLPLQFGLSGCLDVNRVLRKRAAPARSEAAS